MALTQYYPSDIKPYYVVEDGDNTRYFMTLDEIAKEYNSNISNITHLTQGKRVKSLSIKVTKEPLPYV